MYEYPIELTPDDNDTFLVTCPDLPELTTFGDSRDEAVRQAGRALVAVLSHRIDVGREIPAPSPARRRAVAVMPMQAQVKLRLAQLLREKGASQADLGRLMGVDPKQVQRVLDLTHRSPMEQAEKAFEALGERILIRTVPLKELQAA